MRTGGILAFDNVLWGGAVADASDTSADTEALRKLNSKLHADDRVAITLVPIGVGWVFGRCVLKINPVLLLGGITGSMTSGAALSIVNKEAGNSMPALGYTGAYAFANILLTIAGSVILLLV